jgi:small subunit ribosomal protein S18
MAKPIVKKIRKKACSFCTAEGGDYVDYKDIATLRKYISDRGKIRARRVTGCCTRHQRDVAAAVKNAREVALLPYTSTAR